MVLQLAARVYGMVSHHIDDAGSTDTASPEQSQQTPPSLVPSRKGQICFSTVNADSIVIIVAL